MYPPNVAHVRVLAQRPLSHSQDLFGVKHTVKARVFTLVAERIPCHFHILASFVPFQLSQLRVAIHSYLLQLSPQHTSDT